MKQFLKHFLLLHCHINCHCLMVQGAMLSPASQWAIQAAQIGALALWM
jgi:hypothetical protein